MSSLNTATRTDRCAFFSRQKLSRIASVLWLALFVVTLVIQVQQTTSTQPRPTPETPLPTDRRSHRPLTSPPVFDSEAFYRTIIENNLFRPLGWTPPRPIEPYRLIGTILPRRANTPPKAIIQSTAGNKTYIVTTGENIDASTEVVEIQPKQVRLSRKGQQRTLHLPSGF